MVLKHLGKTRIPAVRRRSPHRDFGSDAVDVREGRLSSLEGSPVEPLTLSTAPFGCGL